MFPNPDDVTSRRSVSESLCELVRDSVDQKGFDLYMLHVVQSSAELAELTFDFSSILDQIEVFFKDKHPGLCFRDEIYSWVR